MTWTISSCIDESSFANSIAFSRAFGAKSEPSLAPKTLEYNKIFTTFRSIIIYGTIFMITLNIYK